MFLANQHISTYIHVCIYCIFTRTHRTLSPTAVTAQLPEHGTRVSDIGVAFLATQVLLASLKISILIKNHC